MLNPRITMAATAGIFAIGALTGCATDPTASVTPTATTTTAAATPSETYDSTDDTEMTDAEARATLDDVSVMLDYKSVIGDFSDLLDDLQDYAEDDDAAGMKSLGNDFVLAARKGKGLDDIPDASNAANRAWDKAMDEYLVMGGSLQVGMFGMAGDAMNDATDYITTATAEINGTD